MIGKHFSLEDFLRLHHNWLQQENYLDYYRARLDFWMEVSQAEQDPDWFEVASQNFWLVANRIDHLRACLC